eukprot:INCI4622.1.p2 GENE.INCI4622.1~~INCI4622.1.p2  ORF type:complete len:127 (-),score=21.69 INCI4622.1:212-592(-)
MLSAGDCLAALLLLLLLLLLRLLLLLVASSPPSPIPTGRVWRPREAVGEQRKACCCLSLEESNVERQCGHSKAPSKRTGEGRGRRGVVAVVVVDLVVVVEEAVVLVAVSTDRRCIVGCVSGASPLI